MYAVVGEVKVEPGHEDEAQNLIAEYGVTMLQHMAGSSGGWWYRTLQDGDLVQHSFWLFDTKEHAVAAWEAFHVVRAGPTTPTKTITVDVHEVFAQA
jgi:hypothetical protein